jgi:hypothetical protein
MVALIVGGNGVDSNEVYSPTGGCSLAMGPVPVGNMVPFFGFINGKLTICGVFYFDRFHINLTLIFYL